MKNKLNFQLPLSTLVLFCTAICFVLYIMVPAYSGYLSTLIAFYLGFLLLTIVIELIQLHKAPKE